LSPEGRTGDWLSHSLSVSIRRESGIAQAMQVGTSIVTYNTTAQLITQTEVKVAPLTRISLGRGTTEFVTNVPLAKGHHKPVIVVTLENEQLQLKAGMHGANCSEAMIADSFQVDNMPFRCKASFVPPVPHLSINNVVQVSASFDSENGQYQCVIDSTTSADDLLVVSTINTFIHIHAVVNELAAGQVALVSEVVELPFIPAFYILQSDLHVSSAQPSTVLKLSLVDSLHQEILVTSRDEELLVVYERLPASKSEPNILQVPISLHVALSVWRGAPPKSTSMLNASNLDRLSLCRFSSRRVTRQS
jgi:hypothetical protein